jgi:hypothetical protein
MNGYYFLINLYSMNAFELNLTQMIQLGIVSWMRGHRLATYLSSCERDHE